MLSEGSLNNYVDAEPFDQCLLFILAITKDRGSSLTLYQIAQQTRYFALHIGAVVVIEHERVQFFMT